MTSAGAEIGLVGCGRWGRHILRDLVSLGCSVTAVAVSESGRQNAIDGGAASIVPTIHDLPPVGGVVVATPTATHEEVVDQVLPLGVPVFVEKPLTPVAASAERLATAAPDRLFVMDKWRYHPGIELLGAIARSGELGAVVGVRTTRVQWGIPHSDVDAIWILAPHDVSIALEILGSIPQPRHAVVDRADGEPVGLVGFLGDDPWVVIEVSGRSPATRREITVHCERGVAGLDDGWANHLLISRHNGDVATWNSAEPEKRQFSSELPLLRELRAFVKHLAGGPPPRTGAVEAAANVRAIETLRAFGGLGESA